MATTYDTWALVLAGGDGTRLRALTRALTGAPIPKQYCRITGDRSLLEVTLGRLAPLVPWSRTLVIVNRDHLPLAAPQLRGLPAGNVLVQPRNHDTGPGLLFSLLRLERRAPRATVAVFPSDHYIRDDRAFLARVERAIALVGRHPAKVVLLGMRPDRPELGFGYIEPGAALAGASPDAAFHVAAFVVFRVDTMLALLRRRRPADCVALERFDAHAYPALTPWNASRDFLAHVPDALAVLEVDDVGWSDWGTPEAIERTFRELDLVPPWLRAARAGGVAAPAGCS